MKHQIDMKITSTQRLNRAYALLRLAPADGAHLPEGIKPGQFVQVLVTDSPTTFLRRPISICLADYEANELWLLVRDAGAGTHRMVNACEGDIFNIILPLGNGFSTPEQATAKVLLVGGGVGVAPLLYLAQTLRHAGIDTDILLAARSHADLLLLDEFRRHGQLHLATDDGSIGNKGFAHEHPVLAGDYTHIKCCGPTPMMRAVAAIARQRGIDCEVSLENMMACGIGACLCCVEDTKDGHRCVCTDGPVFNISQLKW